ncbi:hypothetical protein niasHS_015340 [Heterodera schachtii]|uniref:PPPDE domain-containing protein n=1 Tax=Heterodera schachtii TaxID=97005 RepID=A0ABD2I9I7_HETSC
MASPPPVGRRGGTDSESADGIGTFDVESQAARSSTSAGKRLNKLHIFLLVSTTVDFLILFAQLDFENLIGYTIAFMVNLSHFVLFFIFFVGAAAPPKEKGKADKSRSQIQGATAEKAELTLTLTLEEMFRFEAEIVKVLSDKFETKKETENKTNAKESDAQKGKEKGREKGKGKEVAIEKGSTKPEEQIAIFEEIEKILTAIENERKRTDFQKIMKPFEQFLKQQIQVKIVPKNWSRFAFANLGRALMKRCTTKWWNSTDEKKKQLHKWWRAFSFSFDPSIMGRRSKEADNGGQSQQFLRITLNQYCSSSLRHYEMVLEDLAKIMKEDLLQIELIPLAEENAEKSKAIETGEMDDEMPIELSVYELGMYRRFKHMALLIGDIEIHYGYQGVWLTELGQFGKPRSLPFIKKVRLDNVLTRHSVRQIQTVVDHLEMGPYIKYDFVEGNCADFTKSLLELISVTKSPETKSDGTEEKENGKYPPEKVDYSEWNLMKREGKQIELVEKPIVHKQMELAKVDFLQNPRLVQLVKDGPEIIKDFMRAVTQTVTAIGGMARRRN